MKSEYYEFCYKLGRFDYNRLRAKPITPLTIPDIVFYLPIESFNINKMTGTIRERLE